MISVLTAQQTIKNNSVVLPATVCPLAKARGLVLAQDVYAPISFPSFHQSAMDGYAFCFSDYAQQKELQLAGEVAAGDGAFHSLQKFYAVRIFTGAPLPVGADTVVMQEKTEVVNGKLLVHDQEITQGRNVRTTGSEINSGALAMEKGNLLTPAAIGFLASLGITEVSIIPRPNVHIIVTGNELQTPGKPLQHGQVYESNSVMLQSALQQLQINNISVSFAGDDAMQIQKEIEKALTSAHLILLTGGVSVGKYDFVVEAAGKAGVQPLFHKVAQRPGKPLYCGRKDEKLVFGLPGNPASVLSCFYNFVVTALEVMTGRNNLIEKRSLPIAAPFDKKIALTQFLKGHFDGSTVTPLPAQESFRLSSFAVANCIICLPEEKRLYDKGETIETLLLPYL